MNAEAALEIAKKCGAFEPPFHGDVTLRIKAGGVTTVDVKQTFLEQQSAPSK